MEKDLISIIVPVYNVEEYLEHCVHSITQQTYENLEIILVDDGSSDNSGVLADKLAVEDGRIKVIHQENQGCSIARNTGMDVCHGDYLCIIDSDDYIHPDYVKYLYHICTQNDCDMAICGHCVPTTHDDDYKPINWNADVEVFSPEQIFDIFYSDMHGSIVVCWNKIYRRDCIGDIRYYPGILAQDEATTFKMIYNSKRIAYSKEVLYYYYSNPNSVTKVYGPKRLGILTAYECRIQFYKEHNENSLYNRECQYYLSELLNNYYKVYKFLDKNKEILGDIMSRYDKVYDSSNRNEWGIKRKAFYAICKRFPLFYGTIKAF